MEAGVEPGLFFYVGIQIYWRPCLFEGDFKGEWAEFLLACSFNDYFEIE